MGLRVLKSGMNVPHYENVWRYLKNENPCGTLRPKRFHTKQGDKHVSDA
jgi:hypothetical protein